MERKTDNDPAQNPTDHDLHSYMKEIIRSWNPDWSEEALDNAVNVASTYESVVSMARQLLLWEQNEKQNSIRGKKNSKT